MPAWLKTLVGIGLLAYLVWEYVPTPLPATWSLQQQLLIESLSLSALDPLPDDPSNRFADHPQAITLGQRIFFDPQFSRNGQVSCASCHMPEHNFTDQRRLGMGIGMADRNTMPLTNVAYSPWFFWDGRKDSLWAQALEPFENPVEHGSNRMSIARTVTTQSVYSAIYQNVFGELPDFSDTRRFPDNASPAGTVEEQQAWQRMQADDQTLVSSVFANVGKALAAYQRQLTHAPAPFDHYADAVTASDGQVNHDALTRRQQAGLRLFLGKAQCVNCHNGPLFTNNDFHNTAVLSGPGARPAAGRSEGLRLASEDEFNCLGMFSDSAPEQCRELRFARGGDEVIGAQRTGSLRNLAATAPYMHAGQIATLEDVIEHYNTAAIAVIGHNEAKPLRLRAIEKRQLRAFLDSLNGPLATDPVLLTAPTAPIAD